MTELLCRRAIDSDRAAIIELLRVALGREVDERYEALFAWKHRENSFGPSPAWVAVDGDRVVGFRTLMRWEFVDGDRVVRAVRAVDTATHPDYQGQGIFKRLTLSAVEELAADGTAFVFNTPNDQSRPGYLKMGWHEVGRIPTLVRPTRWHRVAKIVQSRVPADRWSEPSTGGVAAGAALADRGALDGLLGARAASPGIETRLSADFLRWRFGTPLLGYRAVVATGGIECGLAIFRVRRRGPAREAALVSVITRAGDRRTEAALGRTVARVADADYLLALGAGPRRAGGLYQLPRTGPRLTWRGLAVPEKPVRWDLTLGDIELF